MWRLPSGDIYSIRRATPSDLNGATEVCFAALSKLAGVYYTETQVERFKQDCYPVAMEYRYENSMMFVAVNNAGKIIGTVDLHSAFNYFAGKFLELGCLFIRPEYQRFGIGTKLGKKVLDTALVLGEKCIEVKAMRNSVSFYSKMGFVPVPTANYQVVEGYTVMRYYFSKLY